MTKHDLTADQLRDRLDYDPLTGLFTWRTSYHTSKIGRLTGSSKDKDGYLSIKLNGFVYRAHRLAWLHTYGIWPLHEIDHRNSVRDDNRIDNLRDLPRQGNAQNQRAAHKRSSTGILGVKFSPKGRRHFLAQINVDGEYIHLGSFYTPDEAQAAYVKAKRELHPGGVL